MRPKSNQPPTHSNLKIGCWNIQGLSSKSHNKIHDPTFLREIEGYDILGLVEIHTVQGENTTASIAGYETHYLSRPKHLKAKHGSEGITILLKPNLRQGIKFTHAQNNDFVWLELDPHFFGLKQTIFICYAYDPPQESTYSKRMDQNILDRIESDICKYKSKGEIILMGDINARTGTNIDHIANDESNYLPLDSDYTLDTHITSRTNQDTCTDERGKHLLEICIAGQLRILNGRKLGDSLGCYTCHKYNGSSTVDYGICSYTLFSEVTYFKVHNFQGTVSDHNMISLAINAKPITSTPKKIPLSPIPTTFKWDETSQNSFQMALSLPPIQSLIASTNQKIQECKDSNSLNEAVTSFNNIITETAKLCLKAKTSKAKHQKPKKPWSTAKLKRLERDTHRKANNMANQQTGESRIKYFIALKLLRN